jgi:hypothetical protein
MFNYLLLESGVEGIGGLIAAIVIILFALLVLIATRLRKCPSDKIMVIYGKIRKNKDGTQRSARCASMVAHHLFGPLYKAINTWI